MTTEDPLTSNAKQALKLYLKPRNIVRVVVGHSTRFVIATAVTKLVAPETKTDKVKTYVGGYAIGHLVAEHTEGYVMQRWDGVAEEIEKRNEERLAAETDTSDVIEIPTPE